MPIVNGKYKNPGWVNGAQPPISAENLNDISDTLEKLDAEGGGGRRCASLVVGTSAAGWTAADCDYLCDGADDNVEINAALSDAGQARGGEVLILPGQYYISDTIAVPYPVTLRGSGKNITQLFKDSLVNTWGSKALCTIQGEAISDLSLDDTSSSTGGPLLSVSAPVNGCSVERVAFMADGSQAPAISVPSAGGDVYVIDCWIRAKAALSATNPITGIFLRGNQTIINSTVDITNSFVMMTGNAMHDVSVTLDGVERCVIANNRLGTLKLLNSAPGPNTYNYGSLVIGNIFSGTSPAITLGPNTKYNFVSGNQLSDILNSGAQLSIQDSGTGNIVRSNSNEAPGPSGPASTLVTLTASGWSNKTQTVSVPGISAAEGTQLITPVPRAASQTAYYAAGVRATGQAANSLTFTADTVPTANLQIYVVIQEVA